MKSIFDKETRQEIVRRIDSLTPNNSPLWGKMTVTQMVRHCARCEEYYYGNIKISRSLMGRIFGKLAINAILKNEHSNIRKNSTTPPPFKVTENISDLDSEKSKWKLLIERYDTFNGAEFTHWFFGRMTKEQLGQFIYKHCDHHLKQFNA